MPHPVTAYRVPHPRALKAKLAPVSCISLVGIKPLPKLVGSCFLAATRVDPNPTKADNPDTPARKRAAETNVTFEIVYMVTTRLHLLLEIL